MSTMANQQRQVGLVAHLHEHPVEDTDFQGCVVHAMPGDLTAWGEDAESALANFDAMLSALATTLGDKADAWRASLPGSFAAFRDAILHREPKPTAAADRSSMFVRTAAGVTYLLVMDVHDEACTPCT